MPVCRGFDPDLAKKLGAIQYYLAIYVGVTKINGCPAKHIHQVAKLEILWKNMLIYFTEYGGGIDVIIIHGFNF